MSAVRLPTIAHLIEDDPFDALLLTRALLACGVQAEHCKDLEVPKPSSADAPELLIVDLALGPRSGLEIVSELRAAQDERPILVATGHGDERTAIECIRAGADDYLRKADLQPDFLRRALENAMAQWSRRLAERDRAAMLEELAAANARLDRLAMQDELTELLNRRGFESRLEAAVASAQRHGHALNLLMIDLDEFKQVNDRAGHTTGDRVIAEFGALLGDRLRKNDFAGRIGGDEFAICLERVPISGAEIVARWILESVRSVYWGEGRWPLACSIGLAAWRRGDDIHAWRVRADEALYRAKGAGRARLQVAP